MNQPRAKTSSKSNWFGRIIGALKFYVPIALIIAFVGVLYLYYAYGRYEEYAKASAAKLVESAEILLEPQINAFFRVGGDPGSREYQVLRDALMRSRRKNDQIRFSYLIGRRGAIYYFILDSEPDSSPDHSPYGEIYTGPAKSIEKVFSTGETVVSDLEIDRWGRWISALTPVMNENGEVRAVLGFDYPADLWRAWIITRMVPEIILIIGLIVILLAFFWVLLERRKLDQKSRNLAADEALYRTVIEQMPIGLVVSAPDDLSFGTKFSNTSVNRMFQRILGRTKNELDKLFLSDVTHPDDVEASRINYERLNRGEIEGFTLVKRYIRPDGAVVWTNVRAIRFQGAASEQYSLALIEDITARKLAEDRLRESERSKAVLLSHLPGLAYRCRMDRDWTMEFVSEGCEALTGYAPESLLLNRDVSFCDLIAPEYREEIWDEWQRVIQRKEDFRYEYEIVARNGSRKWVLEMGQGIFGPDGVQALEGIIIDISRQKDNEARLMFMSEHDAMTGLNNRRFYERIRETLNHAETLPLSVAVCDIDGLHLVNDVFGVEEGDRLILETAALLKSCARPTDILIRTGGDEFTLIMPRTDADEAERMNRRVKDQVPYRNQQDGHACEISLSVGSATRSSMDVSFTQTVKSAQENMHYHKLLERRSPHNAVLSSIMATMLARSRETEAHGERLVSLSREMGESLNLQQKEMDELELYAMLHDIGKVGVDDRILNKPGRLDAEEWDQMKKHSEIGYRIAASASELSHVADYILCHHERWDGKGYPRGLSGEEIPILSRLLSIVDAYDAMTEDRVYRQAMSGEDALQEIERGAGTQFDPVLAERFVRMMKKG